MKSSLLLAAAVVLVRDPTGKWAGSPLQPWFKSLRDKSGKYCCAEADGHSLDEGEWDMKNDSYRVFLQGKWIVVPDEALILGPNKFGKAMVWVWPQEMFASDGFASGGSTSILCFIPGTGV